MKKPLIIAHRGASAYAPENTLAAFSKAIEQGADGIELDVHLTKDGQVAVIHDGTVNRTSNEKGRIMDMTLAEAKEFDFGSWFSKEYKDEKIPSLNEVLELLKDWDGILNVELKSSAFELYKGMEKKVLDLLKFYSFLDQTIISSFNHYSLVDLKKIEPAAKVCPLYVAGLYEPWRYASMIQAFAIHPAFHAVVPEIVQGCREHGIKVNTYTVNHPDHIKAMINANVDGIITDVPDVAKKIRDDES